MRTDECSYYLRCVQRLDFGDGPGGAVYQHQLNVIVRFISKNKPGNLDEIRNHDISHILRQIESESAPIETEILTDGKHGGARRGPVENHSDQGDMASYQEKIFVNPQDLQDDVQIHRMA
ncbi:hypothetical protein HYPSUDRAFT_1045934 [Hypholoma sublateritium FD-334 SS-4]|uniref:Uncharacterized protein n=1 Tax=Hypholoma sublateritium (strain FD-334 SS-4) TaxID=945553 RepID=A0A0D2ND44_HYPSF|nr:hypothetical protein HYPSUDRAFT_1045934 [Hypholoma sublateritium FD-334 SS-4]